MPLPCQVAGLESGTVVHELLVLGWLSTITIPMGAIRRGIPDILNFIQNAKQQ